VPVLFDERGARQTEVLLDFEQFLERRSIAQRLAPNFRSEDGG
jgi:hypothetical protein